MDDNRASSILPKLWFSPSGGKVGEHSMCVEVVLRGTVEGMEKKM